jgi:glucose/arabinose dehydrogenase
LRAGIEQPTLWVDDIRAFFRDRRRHCNVYVRKGKSMTLGISTRSSSLAIVVLAVMWVGAATGAQQAPTEARDTLPDGPLVFDSSSRGPGARAIPGPKFRVVVMKGLSRPYALASLPDGNMLITERAGQLRIVRHGVLDPQPISGMPEVLDRNQRGLNDVALHPRFAENQWVYFTYYKPKAGSTELAMATLARGRFDGGSALTDVRDLFMTDTFVGAASAARIVFGRDGKIYMAIGIPLPSSSAGAATAMDAQDPGSYFGKVLRLNEDGTAPADNPFVGKPGYRPEIYALGIRNAMGLVVHPDTGEIWETENGPQGGDEINIIRAGLNYGWPVISYGRAYTGDLTGGSGPQSERPFAPGLEQPWLFWSPSIAVAGMAFYTGDRFQEWKGSIFVGALVGQQLQRVVMNDRGLPTRRDSLLVELKQRIREVRQGPDGLLYLLTDEVRGALLRIEPVDDAREASTSR